MSLKKILIRNSSLNIFTYLTLGVLSIISVPIMLNNLGVDLYGKYILVMTTFVFAGSIDFGIFQALIRVLSKKTITQKQKSLFFQTSLAIFLLIGLVVGSISFLFIFNLSSLVYQNTIDRFLLGAVAFFIVLTNHASLSSQAVSQSKHNFLIFNVKNLLSGFGSTLACALVTYLTTNLILIHLSQLLFHFIALILITFYTLLSFSKKIYPKFSFTKASKLFDFGYKQFIGSISSQIHNQFSKYIIAYHLPLSSVSIFSIPQNLVTKGAGIVSQIAIALFPLSSAIDTKSRVIKLKRLVIGLELLILAGGIFQLVMIHLFGEVVLNLWLGNQELAQSVFPVLKVLSLYLLLTSLTPIPSVVFDSFNMPQIPSIFSVFTTVVSLLLLFVLTPIYKETGAAISYVISSLIVVPPFLFLLNQKIQNRISSFPQ